MIQLLLGSQSPRRKEILEFFNLPFKQVHSNFPEESVSFKGCPKEYAGSISKGKAEALSPSYPHAAILTADTIVYKDNTLYGKPNTIEDAFLTLSELSGKWHSVYTAVTLKREKEQFHDIEETRVLFNSLNPSQIHAYLNKLPWRDKAGAYGIQMGAGLIVKKIDGCFYNVMGLPINTLRNLLLNIGIDLWQMIN